MVITGPPLKEDKRSVVDNGLKFNSLTAKGAWPVIRAGGQ
ncbi:hypothetical protein BN135_460 [Cronobacter muytjensii 530]